MILDKLSNYSIYQNIHPLFSKAFDFLINTNLNELEAGRIDIVSEKLFVLVNSYKTKPNELNILEAHKKYIDIQYVIEGLEGIDFEIYDDQEIHKEYDIENDYTLYKPKESSVLKLANGQFAIFFPNDLHLPSIAFEDKPKDIKKIVIKVLID